MKSKKATRIICIIMAALLALSLILSALPTALAEGDNAIEAALAQLEQQKAAATAQREAAQNKLAQLKAEQADVLEEKMALEERNEAAKAEIALIAKQINVYNQMIEAKGKEVDAAQQREDEQLEKYRTRIRSMEENGDYDILALILHSDSFSDLLASFDDYNDVMNSDKTLYDQLQAAREDLEEARAAYQNLKEDCEDKKKALEEEQKQLEAEIADSEARLEELAEAIEKAEEEQKAADAALAAASASMTDFLNAYYAKKSSNDGGTFTDDSTGVTYDTSTQYSDSAYMWPFPSSTRVSSGFKTRWGRQHSGVDIDGFNMEGAPIVASRAGTVILAGWNGGYGNCVMIDHGDAVTLYGHMSSIAVGVGQAVNQGTTVGGVGMTGSATGVHLHFEIRLGGSPVDPIGYLPACWSGEPGWDSAS